ncbi:protein-tyrosine phosphatase [Caloramator fervidus]|uniref:protein-tyrosine-phosphatase n=1 Tax=Caloramator fervidus TaxID=29344 RepID=A0A1H5T059_9CLOT|nr:CpsB/CapC family capsule biosynthesis tyrosine phosphatase [Caloramator fervidus]SEF56155.1 protein-tyrosine phosphatase [Caloramator fervidus]
MLDIHSHIIPKMDDGADSLETFLEMAKIAQDDGIKMIVATPHFLEGKYENSFDDIQKSVLDLNNYIKRKNINIEIIAGQEVMISKNLISYLEEGLISPIKDTNYILIELPFDKIPSYTFDVLYELKIRNIIPIIAHPERYLEIIKNPEKINDFIDEGYLFQLNSSSFIGLFGKDVKNTAEKLLRYNVIDFLGSDSHDAKYRKPKIKNALERIKEINKDAYERIILNSRLFKTGEVKSRPEKVKNKKSIFSFLLRKRG